MKQFALLFILLLVATSALGQKRKIAKVTGGLVGYYFWEEDGEGYIINGEIHKPFLQNYLVRFQTESGRVESDSLRERVLTRQITELVHMRNGVDETRIEEKEPRRKKIPMIRIPAEAPASVLYVKSNNQWSSRIRNNVVYFTIDEENRYAFSHSSDSLILSTQQLRLKARGQYMVFSHTELLHDGKRVVVSQKVYNYPGEEISDELEVPQNAPQKIVIFANGYRGSKKNRDETDNLVTNFDRYHYWYKLDDSIIERLQPDFSYYIDGSMGVNTSSHRTKLSFGISYAKASLFPKAKKSAMILNTRENPVGFNERKEQGKIAGRTYMEMRCRTPLCEQVRDTIYIICHSMGYAYALGFCEEIQDHVAFGKCYILAPESACVDGMDWSLFEEVWQYGKHDGDAAISNQDVIAPQCMVKGLDQLPTNRGGRVYMPEDAPQSTDIRKSHDTKYFDWIIRNIRSGERGYIH